MTSNTRIAAGDRVGGFEIQQLLGGGGMGRVYAARELATGERVALKVLDAPSAADATRFDREGRAVARLDHPHVVASRGHGRTDDGLMWLAMELLAGEDLEARLARGALPLAEAVDLATRVCGALRHAHSLGVIHRDLKPSNLFLPGGTVARVKVLDFGVARLADDRPITRTGVPVGTPAYMSPEQARGERDIDARTDLWSLGLVLFECVTGRRPFVAESFCGTLFQILEASPPRLDEVAQGVPEALADLVQQALEKPRGRRPTSAATMHAALADVARNVLSEAPARPSAAPPPPDPRGGRGEADAEVRLTSVVLLLEVRDPVFVEAIARELRGRVERLAGRRMLVLFGLERWSGDEPRRAVRLAQATGASVGAACVATGRVSQGALDVVAAAVDVTARLVGREGITLDATTAAAVRAEVAVAPAPDGAAFIGPPQDEAPFVGREAELGALLGSVETAWEESRPTGVALLGPAGIGKSRLCREAIAALARRAPGAACVLVRCDLFRRDTPFAALRESFSSAMDPGVRGVFEPSAEGGDPVAALDRVRASWSTLLQGMAERGPVVLVIDDAQWLDPSSHATIRWVRETHPDLALAVWALGRPETSAAAALAGVPSVAELRPLDPGAAAKLLQALAGEAPEVVLERAGGHPLFLEELGRLLAHRGADARPEDLALPISVESAYLAQFDRLTAGERDFLKRAAVFGRTFWVEGVAAMGGDGDVVARLRSANLVVPRPRSRLAAARELRFRTSVSQEVAYQLLPEGLQARLHGLAATWLAAQRDVAADELARHWDLAGDPRQAASAYVAAAVEAAALADGPTATAHAARVLALTEDPALRWLALAARDDALQLSGDPALRRQGVEALEAVASALEPRHQMEAAWRRCYFARVTGDAEDALAAGRRALALSEALGEPRWAAAAQIELAFLHANGGRHGEAREAAATACDLAARAGDPWLEARATAALAFALAEAADLVGSLSLFSQAADAFARAGDRRREALNRANAGCAMLNVGRVDEAVAEIEAAITAARRVGNRATEAVSLHNLGIARRMSGGLEDAARLQDQADILAGQVRHARLVASVATERMYLALASGAVGEATAALATTALASATAAGAQPLVTSALAVALRVEARLGRLSRDSVHAVRDRTARALPEQRAELYVALWEAGPRAPEDAAVARAALEDVVSSLDDPEDRAVYRAALDRRYVVPDALRR